MKECVSDVKPNVFLYPNTLPIKKGSMRMIKYVFGIIVSLIIFTACSESAEKDFNCELEFKILDGQDDNLLQAGYYNSDTIYMFQDNLEAKSNFSFDNDEYALSISTRQLNSYNMDSDFLLYLNVEDTDTLTISYERDPSNPCLGGGLIITSIMYNEQKMLKQGDYYIIQK